MPSPEPAPSQLPNLAGVEDLLDELIEIITSAKSMPLSSSAIVTRDEVLDLLEAVRDELPEELRRARRLLKDHEELLAAAETRGGRHRRRRQGPVRAHGPADRDRPTGRAPGSADRRGRRGRRRRQMRHEAEDYVDQKLAGFEIVLDRTLKTVRAGRERLASVPPRNPSPATRRGRARR